MVSAARNPQDSALREQIAALVVAERRARNLSQAALAHELGVSQPHLSNVERGLASLTAEQLLYLVQRFNLSLDALLPVADEGAAVQNALLQHGAWHLAHIPSAGLTPLRDVNQLVVRVLRVPEPRHVTALLPVCLHRAREVSLPVIAAALAESHLEHRLDWLLDIFVAALATPVPPAYRLTANELRMLIELRTDTHLATRRAQVDPLDLAIRSVETARSLVAEGDPISRAHNIATSLRTSDFVDAMNHADLARP